MKKILITGSQSFVGNNFRKFSQYKEVEEISLVENKPEEIDFSKFEVVLHLAAIVHQSKKIPDSKYYYVNRDLLYRVAECSRNAGVRQFVFLSTVKVYGNYNPGSELRHENSDCHPDDPYGKSKLEGENCIKKLEDKGFIVSIIRTPLIYGEGVKAKMLSMIKLVDSVRILPFGKLNNKRNYTYSENLVGFIDRIIERSAQGTFIAMDENPISTTELVLLLSKYLGEKVVLFKLPDALIRLGTILIPSVFERLYGSLEFDNRKTKQELNYVPPFSPEEGIKQMIISYKK